MVSAILAEDGAAPTWQLSAEDVAKATRVGHRRYDASRRANRGQAHGHQAEDTDAERELDALGAKGELAAARIIGLDWPAHVDTFKRLPDLLPNIEVRTVKAGDARRLIVREDDPPERIYVLVEAWPEETYTLLGAVRGLAARRPEWLDAPAGREPAWFVPREALRPLIRRPAEILPPSPPAAPTTIPSSGAKLYLITCHWCHEQITEDLRLVRDPDGEHTWRAHGRCLPDDLAGTVVGGPA